MPPGGTRPENLRDKDAALLRELTQTCAELTELARLTGEFAQLLTPVEGNDAKLTDWITTVRAVDLPHLHSFANGLELDRAAVDAGLTHPYHNGRTEGVNTRTKRIMRQMHGCRIPPATPPHPPPVITTQRYHR